MAETTDLPEVERVAANEQPDSVTADELRALQTAMGLHTQAEFADALGVRQSYVSMLLSGERAVKPGGSLTKLIRQLQVEHSIRRVPGAPAERRSQPTPKRALRQQED